MNEIELAIKEVNKERKANKNKWYQIFVLISGRQVAIKGYNTWIQKMKSDLSPIEFSSSMEISVKEFNNFLKGSFLEIQKEII